MKVLFRTLHLYLSLAAGLVIACSCLTGTLLVFDKEIQRLVYPERYKVAAEETAKPITTSVKAALAQLPNTKFANITIYNDPNKSLEIGISQKAEKGVKVKDAKGSDKASTIIFVNPYTAQILGSYTKKETFLYQVEMLHRYLLAGKENWGEKLVGACTLIFLFILITGIILWWPKTKKIMRQRTTVKWDANTKRLVHDLHLVTGFYTSIFLIITVSTGLIMSYKWAENLLYASTGSAMVKEPVKTPKSVYQADAETLKLDTIATIIRATVPNAESYTIKKPKDSLGVYTVTVLPAGYIETATDIYYLDQYTGHITGRRLFADKSLGERIRAWVKPTHTGAVYGLPTKILSFLVCLLSLIFPVTGVWMWLNRTAKKKKNIIIFNPN